MKEAIILAGGFGTRLRSVVADMPKPMAEVSGRPFLCYLLNRLKEYNYNHIILATGYKHEAIKDYFGNHYKEMLISYAHEREPLGTGGAIVNALQWCNEDEVTVVNGDTLFDINYDRFIAFHKQHQASLTIALRQVEDAGRYGSVVIDSDERIARFEEKSEQKKQGLINGGIYQMERSLLSSYAKGKKFSFEKEVLQSRYKEVPTYGMTFEEYFIDIGIPSDYARANKEFTSLFSQER